MDLESVKPEQFKMSVDPKTGEVSFVFGPGLSFLAALTAQSIAVTIENVHLTAENGESVINPLCARCFWNFAASLQGIEMDPVSEHHE